jgi:hypothetical protein
MAARLIDKDLGRGMVDMRMRVRVRLAWKIGRKHSVLLAVLEKMQLSIDAFVGSKPACSLFR